MLTGRYDNLLHQANAVSPLPARMVKLEEECLELALAIRHYLSRGDEYLPDVQEEMADVLLVMRSCILALGEPTQDEVSRWMEAKAIRLHRRILDGVELI